MALPKPTTVVRAIALAAIGAVLVALPAAGAGGEEGGDAPLARVSGTVATRFWLAHPDRAPVSERARLEAVRNLVGSDVQPAEPGDDSANPDVFTRDSVGLPQNEESVSVCGRNVLVGTNDYRGLLDPQLNFTGWHLSVDGGRVIRNEGLLPPVRLAGKQVPSGGDPVVAFAGDCTAYAASLNYDPELFENAPSGIGIYRSSATRLASCPQGEDPAGLVHPECWPTRRAAATVPARHFADKEWMAVGESGSAGRVVWVTFTDFKCNQEDCFGEPITFTNQIKAVRCNAALTDCTQPILLSGRQNSLQFSYVTVGPDGRTYVTWEEDNFLENQGQPPSNMRFWLRVAEPGSTEFGPLREIAFEPRDLTPVLHANDFRTVTIPKHTVAMVDGKPRIFFIWEACRVRPLGGAVCEEPQVKLAWSDDLGRTWTKRVISVGGDNYFTTIASSADGKHLAAAWFTNRYDRAFHNRQDVELATLDPTTGRRVNLQRLTSPSNETEADPILGGLFIGDYIQLALSEGRAYVAYNANYRHVRLLGEGVPIPQQDPYLSVVDID